MIPARIPPASLAREAVQKGGTIDIMARGSSMLPLIWHKRMVTLAWADPNQVEAGDIIVLGKDSAYLIHRVIRIGRHATFTTKGDFLPYTDNTQGWQYIGRVARFKGLLWTLYPSRLAGTLKHSAARLSRFSTRLHRHTEGLYRRLPPNRALLLAYRLLLCLPLVLYNICVIIPYLIVVSRRSNPS